MGLLAGGVLFVLVAASGAPSDPSTEALCGLTALHAAELAHFGEKDRYALQPATVGFLPIPCADGTRPSAPDSQSVGGCRFLFTVLEAGSGDPDAPLELEARGMTPDTQDLRFRMKGRNGFVTRAASNARVAPADCEAWVREADPLHRYHALVMRYECRGGPYAPEHPCAEALTGLANLAREGVGVARMEYAAHPTARELYPLSPPTPLMHLCGVADTPQQRRQVADTLARQGRLLDAVLSPDCRSEGLRAGLPRLLRDGACPGPRCLELMTLARRAQVAERLTVLESRASPLAWWLWNQPAAVQRDFLSQAAELSSERTDALLQLREGRSPGLHVLTTPPLTRLETAWLDRALLEHRALSLFVDLLGELQRRAPASDAAFRAWTATVPCHQLDDAYALSLSTERLRAIARTQPRCTETTVQVLSRYLAKLPPADVIDVLKQLTPAQLRTLHLNLDLADPARAEALFDWVMEREPNLLDGLTATPGVVAKLLAPAHADRLGGREAVLDLLLGLKPVPGIRVLPEALKVAAQAALQGAPLPAHVGAIASDRRLSLAEKQTLLAHVLRSPDPRVQAAAAGGLATEPDAVIPATAARACVAEVQTSRECRASRAEVLAPSPREPYGPRDEKRSEDCPLACAGVELDDDRMKRLIESAAEAPPPRLDVPAFPR
ncbi:hypothetical protein D7X74_13775 [Corallococcus sp. CA047B]|uniref:hypothetical protein n=1 Tax=Corallococcus sp. CA047B TaxID=2316729 RepID=UPI000EA1FB6D|nr:hypothetical protein [Corallococcus sp. CA047B]RKH17024.1 hypothetical protein D7X74_13775 [Corallococcus sp. CA047B]